MGILDFLKKENAAPFAVREGSVNLAIKPTVLLILDGWGIAPDSPGNAIAKAKKPNFDKLMATYPHGELSASGESVGLPANEVGNTEVGHLNLGAGRLMLQDLKRIDKAISEGTFFENRALVAAINHAKQNSSKLHLMGLMGSGHVHSSINHLFALVEACKRAGLTNVYLHLFTDGRDSAPKEGIDLVTKVEEVLKSAGVGKIATIGGRYYGMDRDKRWERIQKAYDAITSGIGPVYPNAHEAFNTSYTAGKTDEFIEPSTIDKNGMIGDGDSVVFFNFRIDRPRELSMAFVLADFETLKSFSFGKDPEKGGRTEGEVKFDATFSRSKVVRNLFFATMTEYDKKIPVSAILYPPEVVEKSLGQIISEANLKQLHASESEKERFVTYYFDGLREERFAGEDVVIIPSPKVPTYDKKPEMSVFELVERVKSEIMKGIYNFVVINFANADMVAHTGNLKASINAIEFEDRAIGELASLILSAGGNLIITADHGNAEELITYPQSAYFFTTESGEVNTEHSNSPVPVIIATKALEGKVQNLPKGGLADVAPTILRLMGMTIPPEMTGMDLLEVGKEKDGNI